MHAILYDRYCRRTAHELSTYLGPAVGRLSWHLGGRLRGDQTRYAHLDSAEKGLRWNECDQLHRDLEYFAQPVPVVKSYGSSNATVFTGTRSALHIRFRW